MTALPGEVAGLPDGGPATLAALKVRLGIPEDDTTEDDRLETVVLAVNDQIRTWPVAELSVDQEEWRPSTVLGALMLCARLDSRRNSAEGVSGFADGAPVYVQRNDPDVAMLLQLGAYGQPKVG